MTQPWAAQLPDAMPLPELLAAARLAGDGAALCVFAPADTVTASDRRGYAALVIAYTRFEEPVAILEDGCCALLIREGGAAGATAAAQRILVEAGRVGLASFLRVGVAAVVESAEDALLAAREGAVRGVPGEVAVG